MADKRSSDIEHSYGNSKTASPEISKKFLSGKEHSLEFRAEIIPYDNLKDPNAPILAFSGDNINLIFNIPKESFRNLAAAAIGHLEQDSNYKPPEKFNKPSSYKGRESEMSMKSHLHVKDLDGDNTDDIMAAYEEDCNESYQPELRSVSTVDKCGDSIPSMNKTKNPSDKFALSNGGTERLNEDAKSSAVGEHLNGCIPASSISRILSDSSVEKLNQDYVQQLPIDEKLEQNSKTASSVSDKFIKLKNSFVQDSEIEYREDEDDGIVKGNLLEDEKSQQLTFDKEHDCTDKNDSSEEMNISGYSLGLSYEDCPELETAWPVIEPFTETEKIPIKELSSMELNGVLTKYLKLEFSSDFIVLKVSSDNNFLVDAVKYKEREEDSISKGSFDTRKQDPSAKSFTCNMCRKSSVGNSLTESSTQDSSNGENQILDTKNLMLSRLENKDVASKSSNLSEIELANESYECGTPNKGFGITGIQKAITLKLEQKSKEPDENIPGNSPTERLKFILSDGFKETCNETEAKKHKETEVSIQCLKLGDTSKVLNSTEAEGSLIQNSNEKGFQTLENDLQDTNSQRNQSECLTENSEECCDFHDKVEMPQETDSLDELSNTETELPRSSPECASALNEKPDGHSSPNKDFESVTEENEDTAVEKSNQSDDSFTAENSLGDANDSLQLAKIKNEARNSFENQIDSLEDSALNDNTCNSENEVLMNDSIQFENNKESEDTDSPRKIESSLCETLTKETCETNGIKAPGEVNINGPTKSTNSLKTEVLAEAAETSDCRSKTAINGIKSEPMQESSKEIVAKEECLSKDILETDIDSKSVDETLKKKLTTDETIPKIKIEEMTKSECSEAKSEKVELPDIGQKVDILQFNDEIYERNKVLENYSSDGVKKKETENISEETVADITLTDTSSLKLCEPSKEVKSSENGSHEEHTNMECTDSVLGVTVAEVNLSENSFASSLDSFMDKTTDTFAESMSESDDIKSVTSESDDSKGSEKRISVSKNINKTPAADEVDCAPTRVRRRKVVTTLKNDVIPENSEVKNIKTSKVRDSTLDASKNSGRTSPMGRNTRSKSLDPTPQPSRKHTDTVAAEETNRRTRAKTPDVVSRKDIKVSARSSPRKLARSTTAESSTSSKTQKYKS